MSATVTMRNVIKKFDGKTVINDLTVDFPEGKVIGLLGPNGAGKSTLFKMLVGLTKPDSGEIKVFGENPSWKVNRSISYLPDHAKWYRFHTVEYALTYAKNLYEAFNHAKAKDLIGMMKIDITGKVGALSMGQQACFMLAICLARNSRLILLDEPFSGIDLISRDRISEGIIDTLAEQKQTVIMTSHEISEAESLFDYAVFINHGEIVKTGEVESMRAQEGSMETIYRRLYQ